MINLLRGGMRALTRELDCRDVVTLGGVLLLGWGVADVVSVGMAAIVVGSVLVGLVSVLPQVLAVWTPRAGD